MEVVSPPLFGRVNQGAKRRFVSPSANCSTSAVATANNTADDFDMMADDCSSSYGFQATKRRKRFSNDGIAGGGGENNNNFTFHQSKENWSLSPFVQATSSSRPLHGGAGNYFFVECCYNIDWPCVCFISIALLNHNILLQLIYSNVNLQQT